MNKKKIFWISAAVLVIVAVVVTTLVFVLDKDDNHEDEHRDERVEQVWGYQCVQNHCVKVLLTDETRPNAKSLPVCRLHCTTEGLGTVWPKISGPVKTTDKLSMVNVESALFNVQGLSGEVTDYFDESKNRFMHEVRRVSRGARSGQGLFINVVVSSSSAALTYETDEGYKLRIIESGGNGIGVHIDATTYYGARNGLETLAQLIVYDDIQHLVLIASDVQLEDRPAFKHRGLSLDTSRSYYTVESIKRTIDTLALVKMNTFHWHITDSHAFPIVLKSWPQLAKVGAYSPQQVYTEQDVKEIVKFARIRGVRVIPEFDQPAHVGEGFQGTGLTACFGIEPWFDYCVEPPCGQFDITKDAVYDALEEIYGDYVDYFSPVDTIFHMGGDEVFPKCWNASEEIRDWMAEHDLELTDENYYHLWGKFHERALERLDRVLDHEIPVQLWTSHLTESPYLETYLDKDRYIIQIWETQDSPQIKNLLDKGYRVIFSNVDALYMDCGFGGWVGEGHNWCAPYKTWQMIYKNDLKKFAGERIDLVMGAEAALWSESVDDASLDGRFWPRVSALAERLWTDPSTSFRDAEARFILHRDRLVQHGVQAELIQPAWCLQNGGQCPYWGDDVTKE